MRFIVGNVPIFQALCCLTHLLRGVFLSLQDNIVGCKAFISTPLEIAGAALANVFHEVGIDHEGCPRATMYASNPGRPCLCSAP